MFFLFPADSLSVPFPGPRKITNSIGEFCAISGAGLCFLCEFGLCFVFVCVNLGPRVVSPHSQGLQGSHLNLSQTSAQRHRTYFLSSP